MTYVLVLPLWWDISISLYSTQDLYSYPYFFYGKQDKSFLSQSKVQDSRLFTESFYLLLQQNLHVYCTTGNHRYNRQHKGFRYTRVSSDDKSITVINIEHIKVNRPNRVSHLSLLLLSVGLLPSPLVASPYINIVASNKSTTEEHIEQLFCRYVRWNIQFQMM